MSRCIRFGALGLCAMAAFLAGCGASPVSGTPAVQTTPVLSGNYLLAGSLPAAPLTFLNPGFGISATFDTVGSLIGGIYSVSVACSGTAFGFTGGGNLNGSLGSDGSFTLQAPSLGGTTPFVQLTIKGVAPAAKGGPWSGTYSLTTTNTYCPGTLTGAVNASQIAAVSGTYTGTVNLGAGGSYTGSPVTVSAALQQGTPVTSTLGSVLQTNVSLSGALVVKGSSCLTSGTPVSNTNLQGAVEGSTVFANFQMNDGSTVEMIGAIAATDASMLSVNFLTTAAGSCGLSFVSGPVTISR